MTTIGAQLTQGISKEDASEFRSYAEDLARTEIELYRATVSRDNAKRHLESFLHRMQYPNTVTTSAVSKGTL